MDKKFLKALPELPGVYIMYSENGEVIYIGKSINLKNRVSSYFTSKNLSRRILNMVSRVAKIEYIVVNNEAEALILEANLIKKHKPRYNVLMKDSKFYPFVRLSKDKFPYINATRKYEPSEEFEYFGPFTDNRLPYMLVDVIQRVFRIRTCRVMPKKVCLNYHIGRCSAPCESKISYEEYSKDVENAKKVLRGDIDEVIEELNKEMKKEAMNLNFEKASFLRDSINILKELKNQEQYVFYSGSNESADYISFSEDGGFVNFYVAHILDGKFSGKESITFRIDEEENPLEKFLSNIYLISEENRIMKVVVDTNIYNRVKEFFDKVSLNVEVCEPSEEREFKILELCKRNSELVLSNHLARIDMKDKEIEELCKVLNLENISIIDGFDVANYGEEVAVGASVRFVDGEPFKKGYRVFNIKTVEGQNDFGMINEIVFRRYKREKDNGQLPDLILIDGGRGQLNSAIDALNALGLKIPIVSLAKQEEKIVIPDGTEIVLPRNSYALRLLQRVRDEAHRFGNTFVKKVKLKRMVNRKR